MHRITSAPWFANRRRAFALLTAALFLAAAFVGCSSPSAGSSAGAGGTTVASAGSSPAVTGPAVTATTKATGSVADGVTLSVVPSVWCPAVSSQSAMRLMARDENGKPLAGTWTATRGAFLLPPVKNDDGSISLPDQQPAKELNDQSDVDWTLPEADRAQGGSIEVRFSQGGKETVLIFVWNTDMGLLSVGERLVAFTPDEINTIKEFSALIAAKKTTGELMAFARANIGKLNNGLGQVLADAIVNRLMGDATQYSETLEAAAEGDYDALSQLENQSDFTKVQAALPENLAATVKPVYDNGYLIRLQDGNICAGINWALLKQSLGGKEGDELAEYIRLSQREDEQPFVVEGNVDISWEELAQRYVDARNYSSAYPLREDWHNQIDMDKDAYLSSLLILNGRLFDASGDGVAVPKTLQTAYGKIIVTFKNDELGKLLAEYVDLLKKNGWKLTDEVRDFLTGHNVPGYGRLQQLTWDDLMLYGVKLDTAGGEAVKELSSAIAAAGYAGKPVSDKTKKDAGGKTRTVRWADGTIMVIRNGKVYSLESTAEQATLPSGLHAGMELAAFETVLGPAHEAVDALAWGVGSNDNLIVTVQDGIVQTMKISLTE